MTKINAKRCEYCDGTGDVHSLDGEWRGSCTCPAGKPDEQAVRLKDGDKDWDGSCHVCDQSPTVHPTDLCGPCCFGEADTAGGNW